MTRNVLLSALFLIAGVAQAADFSGDWSGTIDVKDEGSGTDITTKVKFRFVQTGDTVSGTVGRQEDVERVPVKNVKIEGNKLIFEATNGETSAPVKFILVVDGDRMEGDMKTALDSQPLTGKVKVSRVKT
jgi:hypothetical protein